MTIATADPFNSVGRGTVLSWDAQFEIDSAAGDVTGSKTLTVAIAGPAYCQALRLIGQSWDIKHANAILDYEATIRPATGGTFSDEGSAEALVQSVRCTGTSCSYASSDSFTENFLRSTGVLPVDTSGKATGGGQVMAGANPLESVTFGFQVRKSEDGDQLNGTCNVVDHGTGTHVKCRTVTDYQQIGNTATWEGTAEVNGVEESYRITVQDNGEPNSGLDTFSIATETYSAAGNVQHGNVQVHEEEVAL